MGVKAESHERKQNTKKLYDALYINKMTSDVLLQFKINNEQMQTMSMVEHFKGLINEKLTTRCNNVWLR